tara:strand:- start:174 stop:338 length:165 start_codon:yes stop_codon:yes gene_type:complete
MFKTCIKITYYRYKARVYLALAKPFGWVNVVFHAKHKKAVAVLQAYELASATKK